MSARPVATPESPPGLSFAVEGAGVAEAAAPTLAFRLRIETEDARPIRFLSLDTQIRIAAGKRSYDERTRERLAELFGRGEQWSRAVGSLHWANVSTHVPAFSGSTRASVRVPCTYDFEVSTAKYLHGVEDGEVPLELLFSGSVFYLGPGGGLRAGRIPWESEAEYRMPASLWREAMDRHFPNSAWIRVRRDVFDRLRAYRAREALPTWEAALEGLLREREGETSRDGASLPEREDAGSDTQPPTESRGGTR